MRLIDADELERKVRWYGGNTAGLIPDYELINAPTVQAIPIEWIRNYVSIWISEPYKNFALNMIKIWEKENGRSE